MDIEIRKYAYALHGADAGAAGSTGCVTLHDGTGRAVAELRFAHAPPLPAPVQDDAGRIVLQLFENALPLVLDMLRSGAQVYVRWDGRSGCICTSLTAVG